MVDRKLGVSSNNAMKSMVNGTRKHAVCTQCSWHIEVI